MKPALGESGEVKYLIPEGRDVTQLKKYQQELQTRSDELEASNKELEQFAYVASHDLQEPLRTVIGFCQLLELEYGDKLDGEAFMYLETIVDGGKRMQQLIADLLEFSRVGRLGKPFESVDLNDVLEQVVAILHTAIEDSGAVIQFESLPTVNADASQMIRTFQNVVGNGIKYQRDESPQIKVWAEDADDSWRLFVSDNGIGIDQEFSEQVFEIFRRLHTREEYAGTGIGLAICRRIVERHGGQIRLVYDHPKRIHPEHGSTFEITIPKHPTRSDNAT